MCAPWKGEVRHTTVTRPLHDRYMCAPWKGEVRHAAVVRAPSLRGARRAVPCALTALMS